VLNWPGGAKAAADQLPAAFKRALAQKKARLYVVDARSVSKAAGLPGGIINVVMNCAFLKIGAGEVLPIEKSVSMLKDMAVKAYSKKGEEVVKKNCDAIDKSLEHLEELTYDNAAWLQASGEVVKRNEPEWIVKIKRVVDEMSGMDLPVSAFDMGGQCPTGTTAYDKRAIADAVPIWTARSAYNATLARLSAHMQPSGHSFSLLRSQDHPLDHGCCASPSFPPEVTEKVGKDAVFRSKSAPRLHRLLLSCVSACPAKGALTMVPVDQAQNDVAHWENLIGATHAQRSLSREHEARTVPPASLRVQRRLWWLRRDRSHEASYTAVLRAHGS
jgi:hypothetical protein